MSETEHVTIKLTKDQAERIKQLLIARVDETGSYFDTRLLLRIDQEIYKPKS